MTSPAVYLHNARIFTLNDHQDQETELRIENGIIQPPGTEPAEGRVDTIDLDNRVVLPGLCDAHIHIQKYAQQLDQVDCETRSIDECLSRVAHRCESATPGEWVLGHGWNQNTWGGYGTLQDLDAISSENPVYLTAKSLHAGWANSRALELCGLSGETDDPARGSLQREINGKLTGYLFEDAMGLVSENIPKPDERSTADMIQRAQTQLHQWGITAIHDFDGMRCLNALVNLENNDRLKLRVLKQIQRYELEMALNRNLRSGPMSAWIHIGHLKLFSDGALGPRTASMLGSYDGESENFGMLLLDVDEIFEIGERAINTGFPLSIHAIGDRANRVTLDALEKLADVKGAQSLPAPHRIEHLQLLDPSDLTRPAKLGITVSMQPLHAPSDRRMADQYWGERVRWSYAWNTQFQSGAAVLFGSDAPVESPNPWLGLHAAITRKSAGVANDDSWIPEECVTRYQALRAYTRLPAKYSSWGEGIGQLVPGCHADLIVLEHDPFEMPPDELHCITPSGVMVNGEWVIREF